MNRFTRILTAATVAFAAGGAAFAEDDPTSLSYISYVERYATLRPAHDAENLDVIVNMPVVAGDRLTTSRGSRVEVVLADATIVWVDEFSTIDFDALAYSRDNPAPRTVIYLADGTVAVELPAAGLGDSTLRLDTPAGTLFLQRPGLYRLDLNGGELAVQSFAGLAELPSGAGSALLRGGQQARMDGGAVLETRALYEPRDEFWRWVSERRRPAAPSRTAELVGSPAASRAAILDSYGDWIYVDSYWAWRPRVAVTWVPYSYGRWYWTPVGWSWISYEPWGWYPYHYGSWTYHASHGWLWCWDWVWGPAWVHWFYSGSYIGWCPRGYYDSWYWSRYQYYNERFHPGRWSQLTLDFRGRIYLGDIDLRPWTVVPSSHFTHPRLDRVRISPDRIRQELPRTSAYVRTGPLLTRDARPGQEAFEREFRHALRDDNVPDLTRVLRREEGAGAVRGAIPGVRMLPTRELVRRAERADGGVDSRGRAADRGEVRGGDAISDTRRERQPAPFRGGHDEPGTTRGSGGSDAPRSPIRIPQRSGADRAQPQSPARGELPDAAGRNPGWSAPGAPRAGEPSPPRSIGQGSGRTDERSAPPPRAPSASTPSRGSASPPVRAPGETAPPGRTSAPPLARPPAKSSSPAPAPPAAPEAPPPQARRSFDDRSVAPWGSGRSAGWLAPERNRGVLRPQVDRPAASVPSRQTLAPPLRSSSSSHHYPPPSPASSSSRGSSAPSGVSAPAPRSGPAAGSAAPPRALPAPRAAAPGASAGSSSSTSFTHPSSPSRPAHSRPKR